MKLLLNATSKDIFLSLPLEIQLQLNEDALAFMTKYRQAGLCKEVYSIPGKFKHISIWEVDTAEAITQLLVELNMSPYIDMEIVPLSDFDDFMGLHNSKMKALLSMSAS